MISVLRRPIIRTRFALAIAVCLLRAVCLTAQETEAEREQIERVDDVLKALDARPGASIADVGSADGFYTLRIARAVGPTGRVAGVDVEERTLQRMREHIERDHLINVMPVLGAADDPHLPVGSFDAVLIRNAYHEMTQPEQMLSHVRKALKPGGRLVMIEPIHDANRALPREKQIEQHEIAPELAEQELIAAGFEVVERRNEFTRFSGTPGGFWLIIARPLQ